MTPLMCAAFENYCGVAEVLIKGGAKILPTNKVCNVNRQRVTVAMKCHYTRVCVFIAKVDSAFLFY